MFLDHDNSLSEKISWEINRMFGLDTLGRSLRRHFRVVYSFTLRDIKTRSGATYFGFLIGTIVPFGHIFVLLIVYAVLGRKAPIGTDVTAYLTTAILPFVVWTYTHQKVSLALPQNAGLAFFPVVKFIDIILARFVVEVLNSTLVVLSTAVVLYFMVEDFFIFDLSGFIFAIMVSCVLGLSTGFVFGFIILMSPVAAMVSILLVPIYWMTSGTFFIPDALPVQMRQVVSYFPLSHVVDFGRTRFYSEYISNYHALNYVYAVIIVNFTLGMIMLKFRSRLLDGK